MPHSLPSSEAIQAEEEIVQWVAAFSGALGPSHGLTATTAALPKGFSSLSGLLAKANK